MFNVLVDFVGDSDAEGDLEKNLRSHIRDNLRRSRTRRYDIATLLKNGIEECFTLDGSWSNDREHWRQRSGNGVDAEGFSTAYVANGGFGRLAG